MATKFNRPKWAPTVIDPRGWIDPRNGELLVARKFTEEQIQEWNQRNTQAVEAEPASEDEDLNDLKKAELVEIANDMEIEIPSGAKKADIIALIEATQITED